MIRFGVFPQDTALFEKKNNQRRARKDVHKRYKYTHQKELLLHQRCPLLFPLPRGECFVPRFFRKENINSIVSSSHKDWMDCTSRRKSTRERGKNRSREGSLFFPPFYDRSCEWFSNVKSRARTLGFYSCASFARCEDRREGCFPARAFGDHSYVTERESILCSFSSSGFSVRGRWGRNYFLFQNLFFFFFWVCVFLFVFGREKLMRERDSSRISYYYYYHLKKTKN